MSYQAFLLKCKQERCHCSGVTCCVQALQILLGHFPDTCQGVGHRSALLWTEGMLSWLPSLPETKLIKLRNSESLCRSLGALQHQVRFTHLLIFPCILQMSQGTQGRVQPLPCQGLTRGTDAHADLSERHRISGTIPHSLQPAPSGAPSALPKAFFCCLGSPFLFRGSSFSDIEHSLAQHQIHQNRH